MVGDFYFYFIIAHFKPRGTTSHVEKTRGTGRPVMVWRQDVISRDTPGGEEKKRDVFGFFCFFLCIPALPSGDSVARRLLVLPPPRLLLNTCPHTETELALQSMCRPARVEAGGPSKIMHWVPTGHSKVDSLIRDQEGKL